MVEVVVGSSCQIEGPITWWRKKIHLNADLSIRYDGFSYIPNTNQDLVKVQPIKVPDVPIQRFTIWIDFLNLSQPNALDAFPTIMRDFYTIDGHTLLNLDYFPQQALKIDLLTGIFYSAFKPPLFKDDTESGFNLLDPADPSRLVYFKIKGSQVDQIDKFVIINIIDNTALDVLVTFEKSPVCDVKTFDLIVCYSYAGYSNLVDLCDEIEVHRIEGALGTCFTPEVIFDVAKVNDLISKTVEITLNSNNEQEGDDIVNLHDLVSFIVS